MRLQERAADCARFVLGLTGGLVRATPFGLKDLVARLLAFAWFHGIRFRRNIILHNLSIAFPRRSQESMHAFRRRCEHLCFLNMRHYVLLVFEILERFRWRSSDIESRVRITGLEHLHKLQAEGRGFFFLTAHLGNWELITFVGVGIGIRLAIVTKYLHNLFFDRVWVKSRRDFGLELLEEKGSAVGIVGAIRKGKAVGFIMDQHIGPPHGVRARFFGKEAWCPQGMALLSARLDAPVLPAYFVRRADGGFELIFDAPLDVSELQAFRDAKGGLNEEGIRRHIELCNRNMEAHIEAAPDQYLWLHKRWKNSYDYRAPLVWQV